MKKVLKALLVAFVAATVFFAVTQPTTVFADTAEQVLKSVNHDQNIGGTEIKDVGSKVMSFIWILSIVVAVIVLMYIGLKFIVGSANEKAEYKKSLMPLLVGVLILVFATTIIQMLFSFNPTK